MCEAEVWVMVDESGDYVIAKSREELKEKWEEEMGDFDGTVATRQIRAVIKVPLPQVIELEAEVAEEPTEAELKVKAS